MAPDMGTKPPDRIRGPLRTGAYNDVIRSRWPQWWVLLRLDFQCARRSKGHDALFSGMHLYVRLVICVQPSILHNYLHRDSSLGVLFFGISQGLLSIYIPQLFPVNIRATATGICFNVGRLVTAVAVFFVGALVVVLGGYGNTILTFSIVFVIGFVTLYFTRDKT